MYLLNVLTPVVILIEEHRVAQSFVPCYRFINCGASTKKKKNQTGIPHESLTEVT